jgi:hypothetical protein
MNIKRASKASSAVRQAFELRASSLPYNSLIIELNTKLRI